MNMPILAYVRNLRKGLGLLTLTCLYLISGGTGWAQGAKGAQKRNMLWRVTSDNNVVYILGSVHMLPKSVYPLDSAIDLAFDDAARVVFELNLDSAASISSAMGLMKKGAYQDGRTLQGSISKETYELVEKRLKKLGLPIAMFNKFEPWVVAMMMTALDMKQDGYEAQYGLDQHLHQKAQEAGKEVIGLETMDFQVDLFDKMPEQAQEDFLRQTLEMGADAATGMLDMMVEAWRTGDAEALERIGTEFITKDSTLYESILFERNRNWVPQIETFLHEDSRYLVVVGALHLVGEHGVIQMLRSKGYTIEQL